MTTYVLFDEERQTYFAGINRSLMVASVSKSLEYAKRFKTAKSAETFFKKWSGSGVGTIGSKVVEVKS